MARLDASRLVLFHRTVAEVADKAMDSPRDMSAAPDACTSMPGLLWAASRMTSAKLACVTPARMSPTRTEALALLATTSRLPVVASRSNDKLPETCKLSPMRACKPVTFSTGAAVAPMADRVWLRPPTCKIFSAWVTPVVFSRSSALVALTLAKPPPLT